jgi:hypothetical protein
MMRQRGDVPDPPKTKVRDDTLDQLLDKADQAMDNLASALHDMRAKVQSREHS